MNPNKLRLGENAKKYVQDSTLLPPWAANAHDFVSIMREALESKYVTQNIGHWIDLLFGVY